MHGMASLGVFAPGMLMGAAYWAFSFSVHQWEEEVQIDGNGIAGGGGVVGR